MHNILPGPTAAKLAKVAELLASPQPGEVLAAAAAGTRLLKVLGLTWRDAIAGTADTPPPGTPPPGYTAPGASHAMMAREALRYAHLLNSWETAFLCSIALQRRPLSPKQRATLGDIAAKLRQAGTP
jgi:hypothetical protein